MCARSHPWCTGDHDLPVVVSDHVDGRSRSAVAAVRALDRAGYRTVVTVSGGGRPRRPPAVVPACCGPCRQSRRAPPGDRGVPGGEPGRHRAGRERRGAGLARTAGRDLVDKAALPRPGGRGGVARPADPQVRRRHRRLVAAAAEPRLPGRGQGGGQGGGRRQHPPGRIGAATSPPRSTRTSHRSSCSRSPPAPCARPAAWSTTDACSPWSTRPMSGSGRPTAAPPARRSPRLPTSTWRTGCPPCWPGTWASSRCSSSATR